MRYFGIHLGHDAAVTAFDKDGNLVFHGQCERYATRTKTYGYNLWPIRYMFPELKLNDKDVVAITADKSPEVAAIIGHDANLVVRPKKEYDILGKDVVPDYMFDHHLCHAASSWAFRPNDEERLFVTYDGSGPSASGVMKSSLVGVISPKGYQTITNAVPILSSSCLSNILGVNTPGKLMGLAGYVPNTGDLLWNDEGFINFMDLLLDKDNWHNVRHPILTEPLNTHNMDYLAKLYRYVMGVIGRAVEFNVQHFAKGRGVVLGGGTALGLELNTRVAQMSKDVVFGPPVNDSGLSLGAAALAFFHENGRWPQLKTPALNDLAKSLPEVGPQDPAEIADMIVEDKVVGLLRGKGEAGPRALGFRSILAAPQNPNNLKRVSQAIKGREFYRPLAPMVTEEHFDMYFDGPMGRYMQYRVMCTDVAKQCLPAIVHNDNSSRPQVVSKESDPWLHELLMAYGSRTGHYCLINTSLNANGKPICQSYEDALDDFGKNKDITLVSIPEPEWTPVKML